MGEILIVERGRSTVLSLLFCSAFSAPRRETVRRSFARRHRERGGEPQAAAFQVLIYDLHGVTASRRHKKNKAEKAKYHACRA
jgi:hypothetical protein